MSLVRSVANYCCLVNAASQILHPKYSNTSQTRGSKLAEFSNSRFLSLFFTSKLAVPLLSTQIRDFCYFLSPKIREFGGITVLRSLYKMYIFAYIKSCYYICIQGLQFWTYGLVHINQTFAIQIAYQSTLEFLISVGLQISVDPGKNWLKQ